MLYSASGFMALQDWTDTAIVQIAKNATIGSNTTSNVDNSTVTFTSSYTSFPRSSTTKKAFENFVKRTLIKPAGSVWICVALVVALFIFATEIVAEKENRIK